MADMRHTGSNLRWWIAAIFLAVLGLTFMSLGQWQLSRADERRAIAQAIQAGRVATPISLDNHQDQAELRDWRPAEATGHWLPQFSLLLDNRNLDGKPGLWLATPLMLKDGSAVLVLRGWAARPIGQYNAFPNIALDNGTVTVSGELFSRVPQLYAIAEESALTFSEIPSAIHEKGLDLNELSRRQNVSIDSLSKATGLRFLPAVLMQTSDDGAALSRQWPEPSVDANKNTGYAMQWFIFAAIAFGALGVLLWRLMRREKI
jgi:cytochrome oxidase assembly protein ShyY1